MRILIRLANDNFHNTYLSGFNTNEHESVWLKIRGELHEFSLVDGSWQRGPHLGYRLASIVQLEQVRLELLGRVDSQADAPTQKENVGPLPTGPTIVTGPAFQSSTPSMRPIPGPGVSIGSGLRPTTPKKRSKR